MTAPYFGFTESQMVQHVELLRLFYMRQRATHAHDLAAGRIDGAEYERQTRELIEFVGPDTVALWSELAPVEGSS
jgi:hypothetical protein